MRGSGGAEFANDLQTGVEGRSLQTIGRITYYMSPQWTSTGEGQTSQTTRRQASEGVEGRNLQTIRPLSALHGASMGEHGLEGAKFAND